MQLKLAEYKDGKFERFLELGEDFLFGGNFIIVKRWFEGEGWYNIKDEKDPLNRFNGLFDGRTYGEGRFVLIKSIITQKDSLVIKTKTALFESPYREENLAFQDEVIEIGYCDSGDNEYIRDILLVKDEWDSQKLTSHNYDSYGEPRFELLGNLHENPELYEKIG